MRDEFDVNTKELLAKRVGHRCSNPSCRQSTSGPRTDPTKTLNIGVAAHITAASVGGPRYDANLLPEERKSSGNGIWLCQNCAKLIDNDEQRYDVDLLKNWKNSSEEAARKEIEAKRSGLSSSEDTIGINPSIISLGGADEARFGQFTVTNRTNAPCWQIWIKITVDPPVIDPELLEIDILEHSPRGSRAQRVGDLSIDPVHVVTDDQQSNRVRFLMIQQMRPSEYLSYYIRVSPPHVPVGSLQVCLDLFDVGSQPLNMSFQNGQPAFKIAFPIPLKGKSSVWMKGSHPIEDR